MNFDAWRPFIAKILAPIIGAIITTFVLWLKTRWNITVELSSAELTDIVKNTINLIVFAVSTGVSAVTLNKRVNPGNAASSHLAVVEKRQSEEIKATTDQYEAVTAAKKL
jgi:hypothetical protein